MHENIRVGAVKGVAWKYAMCLDTIPIIIVSVILWGNNKLFQKLVCVNQKRFKKRRHCVCTNLLLLKTTAIPKKKRAHSFIKHY